MWIQEVGRLPKILQLQEISCELVAMEVGDIALVGDAPCVLVRWSKSDQAGDGRVAWLSEESEQLESRYHTDAPVPPMLSEQDVAMVRNIVLLFTPGAALLAAVATWRRRRLL